MKTANQIACFARMSLRSQWILSAYDRKIIWCRKSADPIAYLQMIRLAGSSLSIAMYMPR